MKKKIDFYNNYFYFNIFKMPTKVELLKQLRESKEEAKENWMVAYKSFKKLTELQINYNRLIDLIKGCDSEQKLDMLKDLQHIEITIEHEGVCEECLNEE
jgi:hypothetical protein